MLATALLFFVRDPQVPWTSERLRALSTHELVLRHPRPTEQRAFVDDKSFNSWHPMAFELHERLERGEALRSEDWRELLVGKGFVKLRPRWPAGVPLAMRVERPWLLAEGAIHMQPRLSGNADVALPHLAQLHSDTPPPMCGEALMQMERRERHQELGLLPRGSWHIDFRTEIEQRILDGGARRLPGLRYWSGEFAFDVEIVESVDEAIPPERDERWGRVLRSGLHVNASGLEDDRRLAWIVLDLERAQWARDLHLECEVELLCAGVSRGSCRLGPPGIGEPPESRSYCDTLLEGLPWKVARGEEDSTGWSVRVRGVRGNALHDWDSDRWWAGVFEAPLADLIRR